MPTTFDHLWALLAPTGDNLRRESACRRLWDTFDLNRQRDIYRRIRDKRRQGLFVNPNPYFAIDDNKNAPELPRLPEPVNYDGKPLPKGFEFYRADYNGHNGLYKAQDVQAHHMSNPQKFVI